MHAAATTIDDFLAALAPDRLAIVDALRKVIRDNLDPEVVEAMQYGMISYVVPHNVFPPGYHCDPSQPLPYAALASQKNWVSLYLMGLYCGCSAEAESDEAAWFRTAWVAAGKKKLDMGKACVRFKKMDDIAFDVIAEAIRRMPARRYIERYQQVLGQSPKRPVN